MYIYSLLLTNVYHLHLLPLAGSRFHLKSRGRIDNQRRDRPPGLIGGVGSAHKKFIITGAWQLPDNGYIATTATAPSPSSSFLVAITASICPSSRPRLHAPFRQKFVPKNLSHKATTPTKQKQALPPSHFSFKLHAFPLLAKLQAC